MRRHPRPPRALRLAVRAGAAATLGAAIALPLVRKRLGVPAPVTLAVSAAGPLAVAVLSPRTRKRDVALFAMQMWAFTVVHEMPYDDPERLRRRLYTRYPIEIDSMIGFGLVYLGEHYVTDLLAGAGLVAAVRRADPVFAPSVGAVSSVVQRLERIAGGRPR